MVNRIDSMERPHPSRVSFILDPTEAVQKRLKEGGELKPGVSARILPLLEQLEQASDQAAIQGLRTALEKELARIDRTTPDSIEDGHYGQQQEDISDARYDA